MTEVPTGLSSPDIPLHFGTFDGRFPGYTLRLWKGEQWEKLSSQHPGVSGEPPEREFLRRFDNLESPSIENLSLLTTTVHEMRHYHDDLISPFGGEAFAHRLDATLHTFGALAQALQHTGVTALPVPLVRWCRKSADERTRFIKEVNALVVAMGSKPLTFPELPIVDATYYFSRDEEEAFKNGDAISETALLLRAVSSYNRLGDLLRWPPAGVELPGALQPAHVAETSALLVQLRDIAVITDSREQVMRYLQVLSDRAPEYAYGLQLALVYFERGGVPFDIDKLLVVTAWAMMGDPVAESITWSSSVTRFLQALSDVAENGWPWSPDRPIGAFFHWDRAFGHPPTLAGIALALERDRDYLGRVLQNLEANNAMEQPVFPGGTAGQLAALFSRHLAARQMAVDSFVSDPNLYIAFEGYLDLVEGKRLPHPPVRVVAPPHLLYEAGNGEANPSLFVSTVGSRGPGQPEFVVSMAFGEQTALPPRDAHMLYDLFTFTDILFSDFDREFDASDHALFESRFPTLRMVNVL